MGGVGASEWSLFLPNVGGWIKGNFAVLLCVLAVASPFEQSTAQESRLGAYRIGEQKKGQAQRSGEYALFEARVKDARGTGLYVIRFSMHDSLAALLLSEPGRNQALLFVVDHEGRVIAEQEIAGTHAAGVEVSPELTHPVGSDLNEKGHPRAWDAPFHGNKNPNEQGEAADV